MEQINPLNFLNGTIRLLMVDDQPELLESFQVLAEEITLLKVQVATSASEARLIIQGSHPPHVCIYDLGLKDIDNDEFYLIDNYGDKISFVVATGRDCTQTAFSCARHGAIDFFAKPLHFSNFDIWARLGNAFLLSVFRLLGPRIARPAGLAARVLVDRCPHSVTDWATKAGVTEAYLRRIWSEEFHTTPKVAHCVRTVYAHALEYHRQCFERKPDPMAYLETLPLERFENYWVHNAKEVEELLSP